MTPKIPSVSAALHAPPEFLCTTFHSVAAAAVASAIPGLFASLPAQASKELPGLVKSPLSTDEELTPYGKITAYNNFYEFSTDKENPARNAVHFKTRP